MNSFLEKESKKEYFKEIIKKIEEEYKNYTCYPKYEDIFNCFKEPKLEDIKVVIIGQDPYHNKGEANGYSFSVNKGCKIPPSLRNIYKEIEANFNEETLKDGDLRYLNKEGVLLLNKILTVRENKPLSHKDLGWQELTDNYLKEINKKDYIVYLLFGKVASSIKEILTNEKKLIIETSHPSPFSANKGFLGSNVFKKCNDYLLENGINKVNWIKKEDDLFSWRDNES